MLNLRPYLDGARFRIRTYHHVLGWICNLSDASSQNQRWRLRIPEFEYDITHRPRIKHQAADVLPRM